jgi:hypothetical protein
MGLIYVVDGFDIVIFLFVWGEGNDSVIVFRHI